MAPAGSPWDATSGSRFDHLGYWSSDVTSDTQLLNDRGAPVHFDACPYGVDSHTTACLNNIGARLELNDISGQGEFLHTWNCVVTAMVKARCIQ